MLSLRSEGDGKKYYMMYPAGAADSLAAVKEKLAASEKTQPETYEERVASGTPATKIEGTVAVYMNNTDTNVLFSSSNPRLAITDLITAYNLGSCYIDGQTAELTLYTAAGNITLTFKFTDTDCKLSYSNDLQDQTLDNADAALGNGHILMPLDAIEDYLGYDVEYYEDFINIVTDNKDIITEDSALLSDAWFSMISDKPVEEPEPVETQAKPSNNKTPDDKYDLAASDIINADGTYTQKLGTGDPADVSVPAACAEHYAAWTAEKAANRKGGSNPSQIPYSEITLENAAEAFPYLGYIGYIPDYIEVMPDDDADTIAKKVWNNIVGTKCSDYWRYSPSNPSDADKLSHPTHFLSSEADYKAFDAEIQRIADEADAADERAKEDIESGNYHIGGGMSKEEIEDILASW